MSVLPPESQWMRAARLANLLKELAAPFVDVVTPAAGPVTKRARRLAPSATRRLLQRFSGYIARERWPLAVAALCMLGLTAMELLRPWPLKFIFDGLLLGKPANDAATRWVTGWLGTGELLLAAAVGTILAVTLLSGLFAYGQAVLLASVGRRVVTSIRLDLYKHIQRLSQSFHDSASVGDLLARLTGDVRMVRDLLVTSLIYMSGRALVLGATLLVMALMDWRLTLVAATVLPLLMLTSAVFSHWIKAAARRQRKKESKVTHVMAENLEAIRVIQAHAREDYEVDRFQRENSSSAKEELRTIRLEASLDRVVEVLLAAGTCAVLWLGVLRVQAGALSPGDLLVFTAYLGGLYKPVRKLSSLTSRIAKATACGERVLAILDRQPEIADRDDAVDAAGIRGAIEFRGVSFGYGTSRDVLSDASLAIAAGETVALVSPSGSGKSTIAHLLLRFYEPSAGSVAIDGRDIRDYRLASLREQIGVLLQEPVLFNASIRDNIAYGLLEATDYEVVLAAMAARAHTFIEALPEGYDTVVGRRGVTLSGGQRQRIAIARAMIRKTPIVILDEPLTGLDAANAEAVVAALHKLIDGRTCIIITHDMATARIADRVLDIRDGCFTEITRDREPAAPTAWLRAKATSGTGR